ncbi:MAG TPA: hypothetical protein VLX11_12190, partial [Candidatus Acidoferrales bacterium]|nr:hypothetical protein [Candidatus Acidoferrales bacterium]
IRRVRRLWIVLFKKLQSIWQGSSRPLLAVVEPDEALTSFVFRSEQIVRKTNTIQPSRLMPRRNRTNQRLETSVCRSSGLTEAQVWSICSAYFDIHAPKPAIGRGVGPAAAVFAENLAFDADGNPYPEHANIIGWHDATDKPDEELKHFWMDQAQRMAKHFSYMPGR